MKKFKTFFHSFISFKVIDFNAISYERLWRNKKDFLEKAHNVNDNPSLFFDEVLVTVGGVAMKEEGIVGEIAAEAVDAVCG